MSLDIHRVRSRFPSLSITDDGRPRIYLDNPGGTQVVQPVIDRTIKYFRQANANSGGVFRTSRETDDILDAAHEAVAAFLNAPSPAEIVYGQNMTSLTFSLSRSIGRELEPGDEIIVTRLDHDANISPWLMLAEDLDLRVRWLDFDPGSFRYVPGALQELLTDRTRVVAVNHASNAIGTINDVRAIASASHDAGAWVFVDSVQFAPHAPIDVQGLGCDFLVCSAYKFFGPHQGILYGRRELLERLTPYKVRPCSDRLPVRFETGTLSHEGLAGTLGAIEYLEWLGQEMAGGAASRVGSRRTRTIHAGMAAIAEYERVLCHRLIEGLSSIEGVKIYGLTGAGDAEDRVPTVSFTMEGFAPRTITKHLDTQGIYTWDGDYYAMEVIRRLGLHESGGMVRVGLAHYNTAEEVETLLDALSALRKAGA